MPSNLFGAAADEFGPQDRSLTRRAIVRARGLDKRSWTTDPLATLTTSSDIASKAPTLVSPGGAVLDEFGPGTGGFPANIVNAAKKCGMPPAQYQKLMNAMRNNQKTIKYMGAIGDKNGKLLATKAGKELIAKDRALGEAMVDQAANGYAPEPSFMDNFRVTWDQWMKAIKGWFSRTFGPVWETISNAFIRIKNFFVEKIATPISNFFKRKAFGNTSVGDIALAVVAIAAICAVLYFVAKWAYKKYKNRKKKGVRESYVDMLNRQSFVEAKNVASFLKENTSMSKYDRNKVANYVYKSSLNRKLNNLI